MCNYHQLILIHDSSIDEATPIQCLICILLKSYKMCCCFSSYAELFEQWWASMYLFMYVHKKYAQLILKVHASLLKVQVQGNLVYVLPTVNLVLLVWSILYPTPSFSLYPYNYELKACENYVNKSVQSKRTWSEI